MTALTVKAERSYAIHFTDAWLEEAKRYISDRPHLFLISESVRQATGISLPENQTILLPDGEDQKSFQSFERVTRECAQQGLNRSAVLVGIGGGATTDLTGYVAASYMRGIDWIAVPTSLAGMVDAAIGGKTGINLPEGKNLVGAFHSPSAVLVSHSFLTTLSARDVAAGMAEVAKCGFIQDGEILRLIRDGFQKNLPELIERSVAVKADVVSEDFRENDRREILNYGHTLGHAIEAHSQFSLRHGEAISIGLVYAAELSKRFGRLDASIVSLHREILSQLGLPMHYSKKAWPELLALMKGDKKRKTSQIRFVALDSIGATSRIEHVTEEDLGRLYLDVVGE